MRVINALLSSVLIITILISCKKDDEPPEDPCTKGNGEIVQNEINLQMNFVGFRNFTSANVLFNEDDDQSVLIQSQQNIIDLFEISMDQDEFLNIRLAEETCLSESVVVTITITSPSLGTISNNGSGEIEVGKFTDESEVVLNCTDIGSINFRDKIEGLSSVNAEILGDGNITSNLDSDEYFIRNSGAGAFTANPSTAMNTVIINSGSGVTDTRNLESEFCNVSSSGSGDCFVRCTNELTINLAGSGNVNYFGNPILFSSVTGTGQIIKGD
jgi:hypothetical protein